MAGCKFLLAWMKAGFLTFTNFPQTLYAGKMMTRFYIFFLFLPSPRFGPGFLCLPLPQFPSLWGGGQAAPF